MIETGFELGIGIIFAFFIIFIVVKLVLLIFKPKLVKNVYTNVSMYCVKCRLKRNGKNAQEILLKNGQKATKATCEVCGTVMFKINEKA